MVGRPRGQSRTGGRKKGTPNRISGAVKENIIAVFEQTGGQKAMADWATKNRTEFYRLYGRLLPHEVTTPDGSGGFSFIVRNA